ncbi:DUF1992 domain-containing protein [Aquabacterium sp. A7-Y]|uniref:DnaJ family domain-containing protein n=1 Tax=Aquabacterium sp. A7-Y TaxID=1349605 RepID=UPI00223D4649|nr:DnaJ family domain-containing protein [Aquabacterium sp. A7-Y]MCW7541591.1 DUF1992 domain-containing protein [Aquabacterium sp. A7-Y]
MSPLERIAEERIARAVEAGELSGLPGEGRPLELDENPLVPAEQRAVMRVLKNAGYVPEELAQLHELRTLQAALDGLPADEAEKAQHRLLRLRMALEKAGLASSSRADWFRQVEPRR